MKYAVNIVRVLVGALFIFSGLVKANDPAGLSYKMHEFFEAWGMQQFNNLALTFSVLMIAFEIIAGAALLLGWQKKITIWLLLLLIVFFTFLTSYAWLSGKFKACGCFGDCIPLTAQQSFFKDVVLLLLIVFLLIFQKHIQPLLSKIPNTIVLGVVIASSFLVQKYTLDHLPFKDCLSFKVGNNLLEKKKFDAGKKEIVMIHKKDGKEYSYILPNYPDWIEDSTYIFDRRIEKELTKGNAGDIVLDFALNSKFGNDSTRAILSLPGEIRFFIITNIAPDGKYAWEDNFQQLLKYSSVSTDNSVATDSAGNPISNGQSGKPKNPSLYIVTNRAEEARAFFQKYQVAPDHVFFCDEKPLLAAARTRPSLMILKDGVITKKVSYQDIGALVKSWKGN